MNQENIKKELNFKATRSSGAGGQHVNKVSSKIELTFNLEESNALSEIEKSLLRIKLSSRLTNQNVLIINCDESRSQHKNKEIAIKRFLVLLKKSLIIPKKRKATKPSKNALRKRVETKKKTSVKKALRKKPKLE